MNGTETPDQPVHRYFDDRSVNHDDEKRESRRKLVALSSTAICIAAALIALWLVKYPGTGWYIGLGLIGVGTVAAVVARRADRSLTLLSATSTVLTLTTGALLVGNLVSVLFLAPALGFTFEYY